MKVSRAAFIALCAAAITMIGYVAEAVGQSGICDDEGFQVAWGKPKKDAQKESNSESSPSPDSSGASASSQSVTIAEIPKSELDVKLESLASQIAKNFSGAGRVKIAVFNFVDL
jgi:hypothetical protein